MFTMMNSERLSVGIQGLGAAETSYQSAVAYARERIQGRSLVGREGGRTRRRTRSSCIPTCGACC